MQTKSDILLNNLTNLIKIQGELRIKSVVYEESQDTVYLNLISNVTVSEKDRLFIQDEFSKNLNGISVIVNIEKAIADGDITKKALLSFINDKFYTIAHFITLEDLETIVTKSDIKYSISVDSSIYDYLLRTSFIEKCDEYLKSNFVNEFMGDIRIVTKEIEVEKYEPETIKSSQLESSTIRFVKMCNVEKFLDDKLYDTAVYIEDAESSKGTLTLCGRILQIEEKVTKNDKPFFVITFDDYSGKMTGRFFTNDKAKVKKLQKLGENSVVIMRCENEEFNGNLSLNIKGLHLCEFPKNYTPKEKPSKKAGAEYKLIKPKQITTVLQSDLFFKEIELPDNFKNTEFTVVDIETTGLELLNDKITEIGAVKIVNGKIVSSFQTLVNPLMKLSQKNIELTGITDEMLVDAPKIEEVYHDFFKYLGDSVFVAHNADFDFKFLKQAGKENGYILQNKILDTCALSCKVLPKLKNHKLNTVCEYFNIEFRHHRALSDAYATAEALIEMVKIAKTFNF